MGLLHVTTHRKPSGALQLDPVLGSVGNGSKGNISQLVDSTVILWK